MYFNILIHANFLLTEYEIFDFPVSMDTINQIIHDQQIKLVIKQNLGWAMAFDNEILISPGENTLLRESILHETYHINYHNQNSIYQNKLQIAKNEAQAKAFAAYFLMPVYIFEEAIKYCNSDFELAEEFGVTTEFVEYRKQLSQQLINSDYFNERKRLL